MDEEQFLNELRATFKIEADEHLHVISAGLLELEKEPAPDVQRKLVDKVFSAAHSLKGAARAVDFTTIETNCQALEDMLSVWRRSGQVPSTSLDAAHRTLDAITAVLQKPKTPPAPAPAPKPYRPEPPSIVVTPVQPFQPPQIPSPLQAPAVVATQIQSAPEVHSRPGDETVRVSIAKLDLRLLDAEEMLTAKQIGNQRVEDLRAQLRRFDAWRSEWNALETDLRALRASADAGDAPHLRGLIAFLDWNSEYVKSLEADLTTLTKKTRQDTYVIGKLVDDMLTASKKLLLLPFSTLTASFPKMVRDLCKELGKSAELTIRGEDVEIDKRILEELKDPLIHLLRNSVDHGVEAPDQRGSKPARAAITLTASPVNGSNVEIVLTDDGAGLDSAKIKASAIKHGFLTEEDAEKLSDAQTWKYIFLAEISTSPIITRLSGRGLGLAIVSEKAEKLGGKVTVESKRGAGTIFRITVPSMLATFRGILVEVAKRIFVVPTARVEGVVSLKAEDVRTVEGRDTVVLNGRTLSRVRMADVLEITDAGTHDPAKTFPLIILGTGDQRIAFAVDAILDEQEVLVKPLIKPLTRVRNVAGTTVLGSGHIAPVLNVADLLKSARRSGTAARSAQPEKVAEAKSILVAEDSITSRMLIRNILQTAGYKVKTAVDGMEAFSMLRAETFDLLVSDVEMPRLNGFDLTARVRADKKLADLPVILVTALETREHRERGVDAGANAYIIKSSFDQSNLLEALRQLI